MSSIVILHPMISMIDGKTGSCLLVNVVLVVLSAITRSLSFWNPKFIPVRFSLFTSSSPIPEDDTDDDDDDDDDDDSDDVNHSMTKNVNYTYRGKNCMETWHIQKERLISRLEPEGR